MLLVLWTMNWSVANVRASQFCSESPQAWPGTPYYGLITCVGWCHRALLWRNLLLVQNCHKLLQPHTPRQLIHCVSHQDRLQAVVWWRWWWYGSTCSRAPPQALQVGRTPLPAIGHQTTKYIAEPYTWYFCQPKLRSQYASIQYFVVGPEWGPVEKSTFSIAMAWGKSLLRHLWPIMILKLHWKGCLYWPSCKNFRRWDQSLVSWDLFFGGGSCFFVAPYFLFLIQ